MRNRSVTLEIDKSVTDEERARRAAPFALIDRGPGFDDAEARWRATHTTRRD